MAEKINIVLEVKFHATGTTHYGYFFGNEDSDPVNVKGKLIEKNNLRAKFLTS